MRELSLFSRRNSARNSAKEAEFWLAEHGASSGDSCERELSRKDVSMTDHKSWTAFGIIDRGLLFFFFPRGEGVAVGTAIITAMAWRGREGSRGVSRRHRHDMVGGFWLRVRSIMTGPCSFMYYNIQAHSGIFFVFTGGSFVSHCLGCLPWLGFGGAVVELELQRQRGG